MNESMVEQSGVMAHNAAGNANGAIALRVHGLVKRFPPFKLGPLDLAVPEGAMFALIGPNGAGKTTLLDLIMGMGCPDEGRIEVFGMDQQRNEVAIKLRVGYASPDTNYRAWRRVGLLIDFLKRFYPTWDDSYCEDLLLRFELTTMAEIAKLSLGQLTRLGLTVALAHRPDLLLLDEPTTGLDAFGKQILFKELLELLESEHKTVVISSHNLSDLERYADHVGMLHKGQLVLAGRIDELLEEHRMVDVELPPDTNPAHWSNVRVVERQAQRYRLLVRRNGATVLPCTAEQVIHESAVTLEELLLALADGGPTL
jgi:ABC-2 type transport system ATP-binding protein